MLLRRSFHVALVPKLYPARLICASLIRFNFDETSQPYYSGSWRTEKQKQGFRDALELQGEQRRERKKAFLQWQAGQREKGAAHRLLRLARIAESNKRHHYHRQSGRLLDVGYRSHDQCKARDWELGIPDSSHLLLSPLRSIPKREK